jgi:hypothetical protein
MRCAIALAGLALAAPAAPAQDPRALLVFLDCQSFECDFDHFRRSIGFVNWVRDREAAQVHVLGTAQGTGSGGDEYTFTFLGRGEFDGRTDTLRYVSGGTDTETEVRAGLTRTLALGLVRFAAGTALAPDLSVRYEPPDDPGAGPQAGGPDPWNFWVFQLGVSGEVEGERRQSTVALDGDVSATRVTEAHKLEFQIRGEYQRERFDLDDGTRIVSTSKEWEVEALTVWSLSRHWSLGLRGESGASTFTNRDFRIEGGPALEFNVFPYDQSTRRLFTFTLTAGLTYYDYRDSTIFDRTAELRPAHVLEVGVAQQEPWGELFGSAQWFQYWHDWDRHRVELDGGIEVRIVRGLSFDLFGSVARVKDQIYLSKVDLAPEEILLELRELGTDFRFSLDVGLSYRFGSIFNNVVNPRIRN